MVFQLNGLKYEADSGVISCEEFVKIIKFFDKHLLVGAELERAVPVSPTDLSRKLGVGHFGYISSHNPEMVGNHYKQSRSGNPYNIAFVTEDSTVTYMNEIIYGGNIEGFHWNYNKLKLIEEKLEELGCLVQDQTTSTHISVLTGYNRRMSGLVLKNIWNIVRAFSSAIYWLGSGHSTSLVRTSVNHFAKPINQLTPAGKTAKRLASIVSKYHIVRLNKQVFLDEDMDGVFLELRSPDGIRSPAVISALMMLFKAIIYKSVELSLTGLVQVSGLSSDWQRNKLITCRLTEGAMSVVDDDYEFMRQEAKALINFVSMYLKRFDPEVIEVLEAMAVKPFSQREGGWQNYDKQIYVEGKKMNSRQEELIKIIAQNSVKAETLKAWKQKVAVKMNCTVRYVELMMVFISSYSKLPLVFDEKQKLVRFG